MTNLRKIALSASTFLVPFALAVPAMAQSLPTGGTVATGTASIDTSSSTTTTINQTSGRAVINWSTFNVGSGNSVVFVQPDVNSATLNRVTGTTASTIAGSIQANGSVYLINPNGIQITSTGTVNVGRGFVASTLAISDADFMADRNIFTGTGGAVNHQGNITTDAGGFVGLLGGEVQTAAGSMIFAPAGTVTIGTTTKATLDLNGGNFLQVALPSSAALAGNGTVAALNADAARNAVRHMVNLPASIEATAVSGTNGDVTLSGMIDVGTRGNVNVAAMGDIAVTSGAQIALGRSSLTLRSDAIGTGSGTVTVAANSIDTSAEGATTIYYNPTSYSAPTDFSSSIVGGVFGGPVTAYMLVNNVDQLQAMNTNLAGRYALSRDIDASATTGWNGGAGFAPVGDYFEIRDPNNGFDFTVGGTQFTGTFDGQNHVISGLSINRATQDNVGLFGATNNSALIRNVGLVGGSVTGRNSVGGLVGHNVSGTISNAYTTGAVSGTNDVGGLVGLVQNGSISNAYATGVVSGNLVVGGLVGSLLGGDISNAYATGAVSGNRLVGGLVGQIANNGSISSAYATGAVTGTDEVGGLAGRAIFATISNAYWDSYSTGQGNGIGLDLFSSVTNLNAVTSDPSQSGAANYAYNASAYANFDLTNTWFMVDGSTRPFLRSEYSTHITNSHQLQLMAMDLGASYTLGRDIDLSETARVVAGTPGSYSGMWSGAGFAPVGSTVTNFTGTLDGQGHVISSLTINRPTQDYVGLFGLAYRATIRNVGLVGGSVTGRDRVGGLAGEADNDTNGSMSNVFVTSAVTGRNIVGGLIGYANFANVRNAYATGAVTGNNNVGGLVGNAFVSQIRNTYATGAVTGNNNVGGLVGAAGGSISNSYWDSYSTGQARGVGSSVASITNLNAVTSDPNQSGAANYALRASAWANFRNGGVSDVDAVGGQALTWRIYDGFTSPLLKAFLRTATVNASGTSDSRVYDGTLQTLSGTAGYAESNIDTSRILGSATASARGTNVGSYTGTVNTSGLYSNQQGYDIVAGSGSPFTLTITARPITVTANALSRVYGDANPALTYGVSSGNLVGSDVLSGALATTAGAASNVGSYAITQGTLANSNYALTYVGANLSVTPRALNVVYTANAASRLYGDANPALSGSVNATGLVNGDALSGTASFATTASATSNVGSYGVTGSGLSASNNYTLSTGQAAGNATALTITARPITVIADDQTRIYGDANPALTYRVGGRGLVNGDTLSGALSTTASATSNVGAYMIDAAALSAGGNYTLTVDNGILTITPRALSVVYTADAESRLYGDANPALSGSVNATGLVNGDALSGTASFATAASATSNVGSYGVTGSGLTASSNYTLSTSQAAGNATALTITARPITVTANGQTRIYGDANAALTYSVTSGNLVNGDAISGALSTSAGTTSNIGAYVIDAAALSAGGNYTLTVNNGRLTITPRALNVVYTANAASRVYGDANPALSGRVSSTGLVNGDALSGTASFATTANGTSNVGSYGVTGSGITASSNYTLTTAQAAGNATALTVTARPITVTADGQTRIYGDANPALTYSVSGAGLVNGDTISGALSTIAGVSSNIGAYVIDAAALSAGSNYTLTVNNGTLTITPRALNVVYTADTANRVYGDANPALSGRVSSTGLVNGDALSGTASFATAASGTSNVGSYGVTGSGVSASSNYSLTTGQAAGNATALTVTARPITVTADGQTRIYGDANPALTYGVTAGDLVNGDAISGALSTTAGATSNIGAYVIDAAALSAGGNYTLTVNNGTLTITPRAITVTADATSRLVGAANPALTYTVGGRGLVNGDVLSGGLSTAVSLSALPGDYAITQGSLAATPNYQVNYVGANLTVRPVGGSAVSNVVETQTSTPTFSESVTSGGSGTSGNTAGVGGPTLNPVALNVSFGTESTDRTGAKGQTPQSSCPTGGEAGSANCPAASQ